MAGEKKILEKGEAVATTVMAAKGLGEPPLLVSGKPSMTNSRDAARSIKGETGQESLGEHAGYYPPTSAYSYYYPGYNGSYNQLDEHHYANASNTQNVVQSDSGSMVYYFPGYSSYASGAIMGVDGQGVGQQQYLSSSGYLQPPVSYGSDAMPCYSGDTALSGDISTATNSGFGNLKSGPGGTALSRSSGYMSAKSNGNLASNFQSFPSSRSIKSFNKEVPYLGSDYSAGLMKGYTSSAGRLPSFTNQKGLYPLNGEANYRSNGRILNGNDRFKSREKYNRQDDFESSSELIRGPRSCNKSPPSDSGLDKEVLGCTFNKDRYNLPGFQTDYENAKFYVIKSYSEDDVHKSIKYDVWASTPNGNKKLDAAFRDAEAKSSETGKQFPIFLFFSVNGSGQFIGLAEMIGVVDFDKDMDFWQVDKWSGFFPVNWHVIKDIPNTRLRHIILENNDNRPVTFTRDTQEIGLKQGLEMLDIFKSYVPKTSLLDDFNFYENREKSLQAKRGIKPATLKIETNDEGDISKHMNSREDFKAESGRIGIASAQPSLVSLTKNLSLNA